MSNEKKTIGTNQEDLKTNHTELLKVKNVINKI